MLFPQERKGFFTSANPKEDILDGASEGHSTIWSRLGSFFRHNEESLEQAIQEARAEGEVEPEEESMLLGILRFNDLQVQDTMIPRTDIDCVPETMPLQDVAAIIVSSGHSRIPVYRETRDNVTGILHAKDVLASLLSSGEHPQAIAEVMREPFFVPETKPIRSLLQEFRARKQHIAIAIDEYGGTSGLITIEDVLEEIVGDIEDEHDAPREEEIRATGDRVWELSGRALLEDLAPLGVELASDEVDTIGGYLCMESGHVPANGEVFVFNGWAFTVLDADRKLIHLLRMEPADQAGGAGKSPESPGKDSEISTSATTAQAAVSQVS